MNKLFSTASIRRLQPVIDERAEQLVERLRGTKNGKGEVVTANVVFPSYANDKCISYFALSRTDIVAIGLSSR